jgi:hypothetical protein
MKVIIIDVFKVLAAFCTISSICLGVMSLIGLFIFRRTVHISENKLIEEVAPQLLKILRFITVSGVLSSILGLIAIILKFKYSEINL